jgi:methionyl-tRNA formyltransferase
MSQARVRIIVFGYHTIGYLCLQELIERSEEVSAVVTHRDDPGEHIWFDSVAELARSAGIAVFQPRNPNTSALVSLIRSLQPEIIFSFYYRRLLSKELLAIPPRGGINLHGSLLPKYRGRSPVNWVLVNGERQTGVTLHYMTEEADAGDIIAQRPVEITFADTALTLSRKVAQAALVLFQETFPLIKAGLAPRIPQDPAQATYYGGRRPEDGKIEWVRPALALYNLIRAVTAPYPGAFTWYQGKKLYVWSSCPSAAPGESGRIPGTILGVRDGGCLVATGEGNLLLTQMQLQGEEMLSGEAFVDKHGLGIGERLREGA